MNSLVVLLSLMALASAKPSGLKSGIVSYAAPAVIVAPAAVSHQSRVDIKSSPAIVATQSEPLTRAVIAEPAIVAAPAFAAPIAYASPAAFAAPATFAAPAAYAAPLVGAPAAISSQSRVDIKSSPAIIDTFAAAPVFNTLGGVPLAYSAPLAATYASSIYSPAIAPAVPVVKAVNIESLPSVDAAALPVAPTETPEVAAARAAHLEAKALEEHKIQKRSPGFLATSYSAAPVIPNYAGHFVYPATITRTGAPIAVSGPVLTSAYGIHPY
ncbi:cuticle protein 16.5-like [Vanessa tameamea]|uniref:Cuticle protein 16.5-like n=1 Tax=Vanessa tameamea TaxID=334116 RepID=A0A8B8HQL0_VANTA|nr:cuticle protein 16.5-like [Vanessa tameamea]